MNPTPGNGRPRFYRNWIALAGSIIAAGSVFAFLLLFAIDLFAHHGNPYMGILAYVVAPAFLFLGLFLIFGGLWLQRRHALKAGPGAVSPLVINLSSVRDRKTLTVGIVNASLQEQQIPLTLAGAQLEPAGRRWEIADADPQAYNDPDQPPRIAIRESAVQFGPSITVPPCSVTVLAFPAAR